MLNRLHQLPKLREIVFVLDDQLTQLQPAQPASIYPLVMSDLEDPANLAYVKGRHDIILHVKNVLESPERRELCKSIKTSLSVRRYADSRD